MHRFGFLIILNNHLMANTFNLAPLKIIWKLSEETATFIRNFTEIWRHFSGLSLPSKYQQYFLRHFAGILNILFIFKIYAEFSQIISIL